MAKKGAVVEADRLVTHNHWHVGEGQHHRHGHWHAHDARDKERHEHLHDKKGVLDVFPHDGCAVEKLPPEPPKVTGEKQRRKKKPVA